MPRFVMLVHDHPFLHWDFLLEDSETCLTWRLLANPEEKSIEISAEKLPDHRLQYLDYEGPVSGGRGSVSQWDGGTFEWLSKHSDAYEIRLSGQRWQGIVRVERVGDEIWRAIRILDS